MSKEVPDDTKTVAADVVNTVLKQTGVVLPADRLVPLVAAVMHDLEAVTEKSIVDAERLAKVETQTRVLAEAVIAIAEPADALAPAVQAVKDEM